MSRYVYYIQDMGEIWMQKQRREMEEYRKCVPTDMNAKKVTTCLPQVIKSEKEKFIWKANENEHMFMGLGSIFSLEIRGLQENLSYLM